MLVVGVSAFHFVRDHAGNGTSAQLDAAWTSPETFIVVPQHAASDDRFLASAAAKIPPVLGRDHFALLTSGSTGEPKLVVGCRRRAEALARTLHDVQRSEPVEEAVVALPLSYSYAFVNQWLWARVHGRRLVETRGLADPSQLARALGGSRAAMLCLVGAQVPMLLAHVPGPHPGVIRLHFAGGRFPQESLPRLREAFPNAAVFNNYGCAEAMPRLTLRRAEEADLAADVGTPIPGVELRTGSGGALEFRSSYGAIGYVDPAGFHDIAPGAWLVTGDLGERQEHGRWVLQGRASEVFKRYGEKVALPQLLATVSAAWSGQAAFYRERDRSGEDGHVLVLAPAPGPEELRLVLRVLRARHARAQWPLRIEALGTLPLLANGKVDVGGLVAARARPPLWDQRL